MFYDLLVHVLSQELDKSWASEEFESDSDVSVDLGKDRLVVEQDFLHFFLVLFGESGLDHFGSIFRQVDSVGFNDFVVCFEVGRVQLQDVFEAIDGFFFPA